MSAIGKVQNIRNLIGLEFDSPPGKNEVNAAINWAISKMNTTTGGQKVIITATGVGEENWEDLSTDNWEDWDTDNWEALGRFKNGFSWDADDYFLQIPGNISIVKKVYIDDKPWEKVPYDKMKDYSGSKFFSQMDDKLYFYTDLSAATTSIKIVCMIDWEDIDDSDEITVLRQWKNFLVAGAVVKLATKDRHKITERGLDLNVAEYKQGLIDIFNHYAMRNSSLSGKLTGIEEFDPDTNLNSPNPYASDYGLQS